MQGMTTDSLTKGDGELTFSILRRGAKEPGGPYSQENLLQMLQDGKISRRDYVFFDGLDEWKPLDEVFEIEEEISHFVNDGQDERKLREIFREVENVLSEGEEIYYIAIQERAGILTKTRQSVAVTNWHLYHLTEKEVGYEMEAHPWAGVSSLGGDERGGGTGVFTFIIDNKRRVDIGNLPMAQIFRLLEISRDFSEKGAP